MKRRLVALAAFSVLTSLAAPRLRAAGPQFWRIEGAPAFLEGDLRGLSVDAEGRVRLGAAPRQVFDPVAPNAWTVARSATGTLYVGTGNDGRVMRVQGDSGSLLFDSDELEVHAVAVSPDGKVYAATSPDGAVYEIDASGKASRFFDPQEKYIWALACDAGGNLYVATGAQARVYRVGRDGKASVVLSSTDTHLLSLALDARGRLYAGSAPEGIVYRVDEAGRVAVLLDSPFREIRALEASPDGVYAAAVDASATEAVPRPASAPAGPTTGTTVVPEVTVTESFTIMPASAAAAAPTPGRRRAGPSQGRRALDQRRRGRGNALDLAGRRPVFPAAHAGRSARGHGQQREALSRDEGPRLGARRHRAGPAGHGPHRGSGARRHRRHLEPGPRLRARRHARGPKAASCPR